MKNSIFLSGNRKRLIGLGADKRVFLNFLFAALFAFAAIAARAENISGEGQGGGWKIGDRVGAEWSKDGKYYGATIVGLENGRYKVHYMGDGDDTDEFREAAQLRPYKDWTWTDAAGQSRTMQDLRDILARHQEWLSSNGAAGAQANLVGATMIDASLPKINLERANLEGIKLSNAQMKGANLSGANLKGAAIVRSNLAPAYLKGADLSGALLSGTDLSGSDLSDANLSNTLLIGANLTNAFLLYANLSGASIIEADLTGAAFDGVNLKNAYYEPKKNPETRYIAGAVNLETLKYAQLPDALVVLRKAFKDSGFREQENKITYALKRAENELLWQDAFQTTCSAETDAQRTPCGTELKRGRHCENGVCEGATQNILYYYINLIFFDWTVRYGMKPERALIMLFFLWLGCSLIYVLFIHYPGKDGIYLLKTRKHKTPARTRGLRIVPYQFTKRRRGYRHWRQWWQREWRIIRLGMFFSLITTFSVGFKEFDVGRWLGMLTKREYELVPRHWTRTVAGFQSLLSLYLLAMWVLTHFGQPFE